MRAGPAGRGAADLVLFARRRPALLAFHIGDEPRIAAKESAQVTQASRTMVDAPRAPDAAHPGHEAALQLLDLHLAELDHARTVLQRDRAA